MIFYAFCTFIGSGNAHNAGQHGAAQEGAQNQLVPRVDPGASKASLVSCRSHILQDEICIKLTWKDMKKIQKWIVKNVEISKQTMRQTIWSTAANEPAMIKYTVKSSKPGISSTSWTGGTSSMEETHMYEHVWVLSVILTIHLRNFLLRNNDIGHLKLSGFKYTEMLASQQCDNNDVVACGNVISKHTSKLNNERKTRITPFPYWLSGLDVWRCQMEWTRHPKELRPVGFPKAFFLLRFPPYKRKKIRYAAFACSLISSAERMDKNCMELWYIALRYFVVKRKSNILYRMSTKAEEILVLSLSSFSSSSSLPFSPQGANQPSA